MQELGDLLFDLECEKSDGGLQSLRVHDEPIFLRPIVAKLPADIQGRWQRHAFRYKASNKVEYPPYEEFSRFIQELALERNDPNLIPEAVDNHAPTSRQRQVLKTDIEKHQKLQTLTRPQSLQSVLYLLR